LWLWGVWLQTAIDITAVSCKFYCTLEEKKVKSLGHCHSEIINAAKKFRRLNPRTCQTLKHVVCSLSMYTHHSHNRHLLTQCASSKMEALTIETAWLLNMNRPTYFRKHKCADFCSTASAWYVHTFCKTHATSAPTLIKVIYSSTGKVHIE
jgi:hypothetical protein